MDNIECTGFIHGYVLGEESFVYYVHLSESDTEESITKEDISTFVFFLIRGMGCGEELECLCQGGQN